MNIEEQVCSKELAMRIDKLGVPQESVWYWVSIGTLNNKHVGWRLELSHNCEEPLTAQEHYSAYTVAELGELLPRNIKIECGICTVKEWRIIFFEKNFDANSKDFMMVKTIKVIGGLTEADVRAKMLIYLIENKLIKI